MRLNSIALAAIVVASGTGVAFGADCVVADPTGTPLNVRAEPNGRILSTLGNGLAVEVTAEIQAGGKRWAEVAAQGRTLGWVFANFLTCSSPGKKTKSAPMHPRTAPE